MKLAIAIGMVFSICAASVCAQQTLVGKYSGTFMQKTKYGEQAARITLDITSVEDGKVKATAVRFAGGGTGSCAGSYEMQGTHQENNVDITAVKTGGSAGDCDMRLQLVAAGNKLTGKFGEKGERDVTLSK